MCLCSFLVVCVCVSFFVQVEGASTRVHFPGGPDNLFQLEVAVRMHKGPYAGQVWWGFFGGGVGVVLFSRVTPPPPPYFFGLIV
jgi:hypothetical protein